MKPPWNLVKTKSSGGSNNMMGGMLPYLIAQQKGAEAKEPAANVENAKQQFGGNPPVGTKITATGYDVPLNRELSKDEINTLNNFDAVKGHTNYLKKYMVQDPNGFKQNFARANVPFGEIGSKDAQLIKFSLDDTSDRLLRLRSGAAINAQEFGRLRSLLPTLVDITGGDFDVINKKLDTFDNEFTLARDRVLGGAQSEQNRQMQQPAQTQSPVPGMPNGNSDNRVRVKNIVTGQTGTISETSFDPKKYEKI